MKTQVETRFRKFTVTMRCTAFVRGFREANQGKPLDYTAYENRPNDQWNFERGRQFAFIYQGKLKNGNRLAWQAVEAMNHAILSNAIR